MRPSTAHPGQSQKSKADESTAGVGCSLKEFKIMSELGKGAYGTVYKVISLVNHQEYVLKKISIKHLKKAEI